MTIQIIVAVFSTILLLALGVYYYALFGHYRRRNALPPRLLPKTARVSAIHRMIGGALRWGTIMALVGAVFGTIFGLTMATLEMTIGVILSGILLSALIGSLIGAVNGLMTAPGHRQSHSP